MNKAKNVFYLLGLILIVGFKPLSASAWGASGHRIIGEISETLLTGKAKKRITAVLGNASIAMVSNWGDEVRSDKAYDYAVTWHYTNLDSGLTRAAFDTLALQWDKGQNIYRVIKLAEHLRQTPNDTAMLKMLIHLVEDMHCPMHMGRENDRGGNDLPITWFRNKSNLHSLWDSGLIDSQKLSYTEYATHLIRVHSLQRKRFNGNTGLILDWAWKVYCNTQLIYASAPEAAQSYEYIYHYKPLLEKSLVEAAEHLAALLNYIYR